MVRHIDENGFRWLEPPHTPEEQMLLGGKPPFPGSVHAETFSVSVDATYERYRDLGLSGFDLTFYYAYGSNLLNATVNGKVLGHEYPALLVITERPQLAAIERKRLHRDQRFMQALLLAPALAAVRPA